MNYYIIPKNNCKTDIFLSINSNEIKPCISHSLIYYLNNIYKILLSLENSITNNITIEYINKIVNPFEFIHTNVPGTILSVSKVKPDSSLFFDLMEIFNICNIIDILSVKNKIHIGNFTNNFTSTNYLLNMLREDNDDTIINELFEYDVICEKYIKNTHPTKIDLLIFEFKDEDYNDITKYIKNIILSFYIALKYQSNNGTCIIKFDHIFYKPIIDIIFILSSIYEKVFLIKPTISKITKGERYIICKNFDAETVTNKKILYQLEEKVKEYLEVNENLDTNDKIHSFLRNDIPYYFLNKIEESNIVIGQQQLDSYNQIINIFKNKNKEDKIETLKRNHIQKCIQWCEKNQIPHNKFTDKINIFLNTKRKECEDSIKSFQENP
jgi:hypothetical protein